MSKKSHLKVIIKIKPKKEKTKINAKVDLNGTRAELSDALYNICLKDVNFKDILINV